MCRVVRVAMAVPAMQEQVQHGAQEEQQVWEHAADVRPVFCDEKKPGNSEECEQNQTARRP
jgi:hypothetical protein